MPETPSDRGSLDLLDPDEWNEGVDRAARERAERRRARQARYARPDRPRAEHGTARRLAGTRWGRVLIGCVAALALATLAGLVALWPAPRS